MLLAHGLEVQITTNELAAAALFRDSGIGRIKFVHNRLVFTVLVREVKTED